LLASNGPEETSYEIADIRTEGNRIISSNEILSKVYSRVGELFDEDKANDDARRIAGLLGVRSCSWSIGEPVDNLRKAITSMPSWQKPAGGLLPIIISNRVTPFLKWLWTRGSYLSARWFI
jgi:hypothetical protein